MVRGRGPGSTLGWDFLFFLKKHSQKQVKNFLRVLEMEATFYERDNCVGDTTRKGKRNGSPTGTC